MKLLNLFLTRLASWFYRVAHVTVVVGPLKSCVYLSQNITCPFKGTCIFYEYSVQVVSRSEFCEAIVSGFTVKKQGFTVTL